MKKDIAAETLEITAETQEFAAETQEFVATATRVRRRRDKSS